MNNSKCVQKIKTQNKFISFSAYVIFSKKVSNKNIVDTEEAEMIIPKGFFEQPKVFIMFEIPYCSKNELVAKRLLQKFHEFTKNTYDVAIKWVTRTVKSLFSLKDKNPYPSCVIYEGTCNCGENYIGETVRNASVRWNEHEEPKKDSEPEKH